MKIAGADVLVLGGAGFIGSHLVRDLLERGARVGVFDDLSSGLAENLAPVAGEVEFIRGSILDSAALARAMRGRDAVSHHAAQLEITKCIDDPLGDLTTNLIGTINVLTAARDAGVKKIVNASSACVYGQNGTGGPSDEALGPTDPNWSYGASKLAAEKYAQVFAADYGLDVTSFRYGIVYGEREWYGRVLTIFLRRALAGDAPVVFGAGSQVRDFTYVGDVVEANRRALERDAQGAIALNVGTAVATSVRDLADLVCDLTGVGAPVHEQIAPGEASSLVDGRVRLPAELERMQLGNDRIARVLGFRPATRLRDGLAHEWAWLREHPQRWTVMHY
ncbi:MAG: NAD-dependent epimerase/dehydratase family protein [Candidatus Elarobacter sp.]